MANLKTGDLVVLTSGSMRMGVESVEGDQVSCLWCHEGTIGRDTFPAVLLKQWEFREDDRGSSGRGAPYKGDKEGGGKRFNDDRGAPKGKPGWDGKPREKKFFRKD